MPCRTVLLAWGSRAQPNRAAAVVELLAGCELVILGRTAHGQPMHPLNRVLPDRGDPANFLNDVLKEFEPRIGAIAVENRAWSEQILALRQVRPDVELRLASDVMAPLRMVSTTRR